MAKAEEHLEPCLKRLSGRRISFLCGDPGPLALSAVIASKKGEGETCEVHCERLCVIAKEAASDVKGNPDELLYGRAGCLWALLFVRHECPHAHIDNQVIQVTEIISLIVEKSCKYHSPLQKLIETILHSGTSYAHKHKSSTPLMYAWHKKVIPQPCCF